MKKQHPVPYQIYTLAQIENCLELRDAPFLQFRPRKTHYVGLLGGGIQVIQKSQLEGNLSSLEGWADTEWKYLYETEEWIPIFTAVDDAAIEALCVIEPDTCEFRTDATLFVYPKGTVCNQYRPYDEKTHGHLLERDE